MEFIDDRDEFTRRLPLMAAGRDFSEPVGLNWTQDGTDVDFGYDGRMYISDWVEGWYQEENGRILTVHDPRHVDDPRIDGPETLVVREVPALLRNADSETLVRDVLSDLLAQGSSERIEQQLDARFDCGEDLGVRKRRPALITLSLVEVKAKLLPLREVDGALFENADA